MARGPPAPSPPSKKKSIKKNGKVTKAKSNGNVSKSALLKGATAEHQDPPLKKGDPSASSPAEMKMNGTVSNGKKGKISPETLPSYSNGKRSNSPDSTSSSPKSRKRAKSRRPAKDEAVLKPPAAASSSPSSSANPRKRGRKLGTAASLADSAAAKKIKLSFRNSVEGVCLSVGAGDTGQLGLGDTVMERTKPGLVKGLANVVDLVAGGMHSMVLTADGVVWTFGCNDEGSLGRIIDDDDEGFEPGKVDIPGKVVQITAGDSHSVCLTEDGKAYYWGTFRDSSGSFGLTPEGVMQKLPVPLAHNLSVKKIASGTDHIALLTTDGALYTLGCAEQGQLGRVGERFTARGARRGLNKLLQPDRVHAKKRTLTYKDVWAGSYNTFALTADGDILVCGLNNYNQLGIGNGQAFFTLVKAESFTNNKWAQIALGQHHTLALDNDGKVYALGRNDYGRLGLGEKSSDAKVPTLITKLADKKIVDVSCGTTVSFAVSETGECYSWGMGSNGQLAHDTDEDSWYPEPVIGKQLESRKVILASGGGQHTVLLAA